MHPGLFYAIISATLPNNPLQFLLIHLRLRCTFSLPDNELFKAKP